MNKSVTMRLFASFLLILLMVNLSPVAFAADENPIVAADYSTGVDEQALEGEEYDNAEQVRMTVWGTFAEAQNYYGHDWTYVIVGYNAALGYFVCYYTMTDGTRNYFGCYSL